MTPSRNDGPIGTKRTPPFPPGAATPKWMTDGDDD